MFLSIIILPLLGSIASGLLGRKIGVNGTHIITCTCLSLSSILATVAFYEVGICGSPVSIFLMNWIDSEFMSISWEFYFDQVTVSLQLAVLYCSTLIHIYSISYTAGEPHVQRFFSYLSLFTFGMLVLITGANYFVMFVGWELIGVVSYLLINYYFTRIQANKAAILALTMNRMGAKGSRISLTCLKLSNSGDALKLMIPSHNRKFMSGQNNYLGMVTSHKMIENEMGYRGSKSVLYNSAVKEQRVDGSWSSYNLNNSLLRYTLMGFERNYQIKVLSKQLNIKNFCTNGYAPVQDTKLNPWFVTGFCDGEASFNISIYKNKRMKETCWIVQPSFQISLHSRDIELLLKLKEFFGCGIIVRKNNRNEISFRVNSVHHLTNIIIPHFINYPLLSQKGADFNLFKQIVDLINNKDHLTEIGLQNIINIRASMNLGLSDLQKSEFINYKPVTRPIINNNDITDNNWIAGFSTAEGCFLISVSKSNNKVGYNVQLNFKISQHLRDKGLLELIAKHLNCGSVNSHSENAFVFKVGKFSDINNIIIPFFKAQSIEGIKNLDYKDFCEVANLIGEGKHLSPIGIAEIISIKDRMNSKRK
jgi:hypothetical protein